ncbi:MAG: hypothetical protein GY835_03995 [bacterium]|nr:hypothetical protein [bacterium]
MRVTELLAEWMEIFDFWREQIFHQPMESLETAIALQKRGQKVSQLIEGLGLISVGSSAFVNDQLDVADNCFRIARLLLSECPLELAIALRKHAAVKSRLGVKDEAFRLLNLAESMIEEESRIGENQAREERGRIILQRGAVFHRYQEYASAIDLYIEAMKYLDKHDEHYALALHNSSVALVMLRSNPSCHEVAERLARIRRDIGFSPRSRITVIADWLDLLTGISLGHPERAIKQLPSIRKRLSKWGYPGSATVLLEIDLAQAYYRSDLKKESVEALERAASSQAGNIADEIRLHIEKIKRGLQVEPWDVRHLASFTTTQSSTDRPELTRWVGEVVRSLIPRVIPQAISRSDASTERI